MRVEGRGSRFEGDGAPASEDAAEAARASDGRRFLLEDEEFVTKEGHQMEREASDVVSHPRLVVRHVHLGTKWLVAGWFVAGLVLPGWLVAGLVRCRGRSLLGR